MMNLLAHIALGWAALQLLVALVNFLWIQRWRGPAKAAGLVSVLIPARNEEHTIPQLISDLVKQDYPHLEILIFDDQSDDGTADIIRCFMKSHPEVRLIQSSGLPSGWLGKNHACHSLASEARGEYLLFLDADVRVDRQVISRAVSHARHHELALLSIFPTQYMKSWQEEFTVPLMNYILLTLLPLALVQYLPMPAIAAANGQFMLFRSTDYRALLPHQRVQNSMVEDIEIARMFKREKRRIACLSGRRGVSCHMYDSYQDALKGFSKNILMSLGNSPLASVAFWILTGLGIVPVVLVFPPGLVGIYLGLLVFTRTLVSLVSEQDSLKNILYMVPQQVTLGVLIIKGMQVRFSRKYVWKGRAIS